MLKRAAKTIVARTAKRYPAQLNSLATFIHQRTGFAKTQAERVLAQAKSDPIQLSFDFSSLPSPVKHYELIRELYAAQAISEIQVHKWLSRLFADRRFAEFEEALNTPIEGLAHLWLYHATRLEHYRGRPHHSDLEIFSLAEIAAGTPYFHRSALNLATQQFCMSGNLSLLRMILGYDNNRARQLSRVSIMGAIRFLIKNGQNDEAAKLLVKYLDGVSEDRRLYFIEPILELGGKDKLGFDVPKTWRETLEIFRDTLSSADKTVRDEFDAFIMEPFFSIPEHLDYMDVRMNHEVRKGLQDQIVYHLENKKALSLIRLGDGEAYSFPAPAISTAPEGAFAMDNEIRERHWWGTSPPDCVRQEIKRASFAAIAAADILGIPSVYRFIRDGGRVGSALGNDRSKRGLATVMNALREHLPPSSRVFTEERCHQVIFDEAFLRDLANKAEHILVVSCWSKDQIESDFLATARFIQIPPHTKVREAGATTTPALYEVYGDLNAAIAFSAKPGALVLVGAGLIGKIFLHTAKVRGAVALDIGSVLDYMAGRKTRSVTDMV